MNKPLFVRLSTLVELLGVSKSTICNWVNPNSKQFKPDFPAKIRIGKRAMGWSLASIEVYIEDQARKTDVKKEV